MSTESKASTTILVLEDDPKLREMLVLVLRDAGYLVAAAENVREALDIARNAVPDMVLVDIMMPRISGLDFARIIRATMPAPLRDVPIIALSGMDQGEWGEKALVAGCNEFVAKPIMPDELLEVVRRYTS